MPHQLIKVSLVEDKQVLPIPQVREIYLFKAFDSVSIWPAVLQASTWCLDNKKLSSIVLVWLSDF